MSEVARGENLTLTITLKNTKPVEVVDLGLSLQALGKQYEHSSIRMDTRNKLATRGSTSVRSKPEVSLQNCKQFFA